MKPVFTLLAFLLVHFLSAQGFTISPYQAFGLNGPIVADFTGDNKKDVLGLQFSTPNRVVLQAHTGSAGIAFAEKDLGLSFSTSGQPAAGDIDGDGDLDVVIAKDAALNIFLLLNDGQGNFTMDSLGISGSRSFRIADVDHDGDLDIVGIDGAKGSVRMYINNGGLKFSTLIILASSSNLEVFDIGDLDQDNDVDVVLGYYQFSGNQIVAVRNNGNGTFEFVTVIADNFSSIADLQVVDIDNDGKNDIVALKSFYCDAFLNKGSLSFQRKNLVSPSGIVLNVEVADFDGDGRKDLAIGYNSQDITWHKNLSNSTLEFNTQTVGTVAPAYSLVSGDLDNDGDMDLVVSNGEFWWYENGVPQALGTINLPNAEIGVFPNPFRDRIQLTNLESGTYHAVLLDAAGRQVYASEQPDATIELPALPTGRYVLQLTDTRTGQRGSIQLSKVK